MATKSSKQPTTNKPTGKPTAPKTGSTRKVTKKNAKPTAGARQRRAKQTAALKATSGRVAKETKKTAAKSQAVGKTIPRAKSAKGGKTAAVTKAAVAAKTAKPTKPAKPKIVAAKPEATTYPTDELAQAAVGPTPLQEIEQIRASAERLGIELDEEEALQWLTQMAVQDKDEITVDAKNFVYGAKVAILDFSPQDLTYFRHVGKIVAILDQPGLVETALALSGSAAQSKIQRNPGDADFFQRVNIKAPTRAEAVQVLADVMRSKALSMLRGNDYQFLSLKFGTHAEDVERNKKPIKKGSPMTWTAKDLEAGGFEVGLADGTKKLVRWQDGMVDPGWTKLDWIVADTQRGQLANASNLLDVTWEEPNGEITPLDGFVDPYFQEIYLDAASVPIFSKLVREVDDNAVDKYVADLEHEVYKYLVKTPNYGKVAKRAYNIFRLTDRYAEAAYIREIFDEPTTVLYRVWSLLDTLSGAQTPDSQLDRVALLKQYDSLIESVVIAAEGEKEIRIVRALMRARDEALGLQPVVESLEQQFSQSRGDVMEILNEYFHDLLYGFPPIAEFLEEIRQRHYD